MDKNGIALRGWEALGFGFVEIGTITARPQSGNARPRLFRYPEQSALVNRMGFNNDGADAVAARLDRLRKTGKWPADTCRNQSREVQGYAARGGIRRLFV